MKSASSSSETTERAFQDKFLSVPGFDFIWICKGLCILGKHIIFLLWAMIFCLFELDVRAIFLFLKSIWQCFCSLPV